MSLVRSLFAASLVSLVATAAYADKPKWTPPQQAFDVCAKAKTGDACTFKGRRDHDVTGTCQTPKDGGKALVCKPDHPMHGGGGSAAH